MRAAIGTSSSSWCRTVPASRCSGTTSSTLARKPALVVAADQLHQRRLRRVGLDRRDHARPRRARPGAGPRRARSVVPSTAVRRSRPAATTSSASPRRWSMFVLRRTDPGTRGGIAVTGSRGPCGSDAIRIDRFIVSPSARSGGPSPPGRTRPPARRRRRRRRARSSDRWRPPGCAG